MQQLSFHLWNLPVSALSFLFSFFVFFLVIAVPEPLVRRRLPVSMDESQEVQLMGRVFHSKMRGVNNALFQMALGLSVFSLIDLPVETVPDLLPPLITLLSCSLICFASVSAR